MAGGWLRLRAALDRQFQLLVVGLLVLVLVGGWMTYGAHVEPGTTTESRTVSAWSTTGEYTHAATVTEPNSVYPVGTTLSNRSLYFARVTPTLNGSFVFTYNSSDSGRLDTTVTKRVLLRSVESADGQPVEVWRQSRSRDTVSAAGVEPGETVKVPFSVNVNRTINQTDQIAEQLGNPPGETRLEVQTNVTLTGTVNDRRVDRTEQHRLLVTLGGGIYRVNATDSTERFETTRTVEVPREPGLLGAAGGPLLFGIGFVGLVGLVTARTRNDIGVTDAERERLSFEDERSEFDDWIHAVELPPEAEDLPRAEAASLGDLVDFAIDTNSGVVEATEGESYYVVHDGYLYTYEAPSLESDASDSSTDDSPSPPSTDESDG